MATVLEMHRLLFRKKAFTVNIVATSRQFKSVANVSLFPNQKGIKQLLSIANVSIRNHKRFLSTAASTEVENSGESNQSFSVLADTENFDDYYDRPRFPVVPDEPEYLDETRHLHQIPNKKVFLLIFLIFLACNIFIFEYNCRCMKKCRSRNTSKQSLTLVSMMFKTHHTSI